jgi:ERCC4-type nuclease
VESGRQALPAGDYSVLGDDGVVAAVARKTFEDLVKSLVDGKLGFLLAELAALPTAAVVVEERYGALAAAPRVTAGWPCELVVRLQVRYPAVPIVFADSRKLAEDYTHRFLATAAAHHRDAG